MLAETQEFLILVCGDGKLTNFASALYPWGQIFQYPLDRRVVQSKPAAFPGWT
jgi:hypothetical protein